MPRPSSTQRLAAVEDAMRAGAGRGLVCSGRRRIGELGFRGGGFEAGEGGGEEDGEAPEEGGGVKKAACVRVVWMDNKPWSGGSWLRGANIPRASGDTKGLLFFSK
jgi:hypothetical protein